MKIVIEVKNGMIERVFAKEDIDVITIDYDAQEQGQEIPDGLRNKGTIFTENVIVDAERVQKIAELRDSE